MNTNMYLQPRHPAMSYKDSIFVSIAILFFFLYDEDDKETERKIKSNLKSIVEFPFDMPILERMWLLCGYFLWLHKNANGLILCGDPGPFQVLHCFDSLLRYL